MENSIECVGQDGKCKCKRCTRKVAIRKYQRKMREMNDTHKRLFTNYERPKNRECLSCGTPFKSEWKGNRICQGCKGANHSLWNHLSGHEETTVSNGRK